MTTKIENISKGIIEYIDLYKKDLSKEMEEKDLRKYIRKLVKKNLKKFIDKENIDKPKRCKSAFIFYCEDVREQIKKEIPNIKVTDIIVEQSKRWKELKEKNPKKVDQYLKKALKDKIRYENEKKEYERNKLMKESTEDKKVIKEEYESEDESEHETEKEPEVKKSKKITLEEDSSSDDEKPISIVKKETSKSKKVKEEVVENKKEDTGFENFYNKKYKKIKKSNPEYSDDKISDKIKKKWKKLSEEDQLKYA